jgi:uncharacterized RDD family membrane protein YckC
MRRRVRARERPRVKLDTTVHAETPEGIDILLRPAGTSARVLAYALDWFIRLVIFGIVAIPASAFKGLGGGLMLIVYFGLEWLYPIVFELLPGSATPGKRALGLQVLMDTGLPITPAAAVTRNLLRVVDLMPIAYAAGVLSMLLRHDFKRIGDILAGTLVVHSDHVRLAGALPAAEPLAPRVPLTRTRQVAILRLAGRAARLTPERVDELATLAEGVLPAPDLAPGRSSPPPIRPGPRLLAVAQWLAGQR